LANRAFTQTGQVIRMGVPPLRSELVTSISGVDFDACYAGRIESVIDDVRVSNLNLPDLKRNKKAAGRPKDLVSIQYQALAGPAGFGRRRASGEHRPGGLTGQVSLLSGR